MYVAHVKWITVCLCVCSWMYTHEFMCLSQRTTSSGTVHLLFFFLFFFWDWAFISIKLAKQTLHILLSAFLSLGLERNAPVVGFKKQKQNTKPLSSEDPSKVLLLAKQVLHQRRLPQLLANLNVSLYGLVAVVCENGVRRIRQPQSGHLSALCVVFPNTLLHEIHGTTRMELHANSGYVHTLENGP